MPNVCVCMCVYVYDARTLCYARCVPISLVGSSRNQVAGRRREGGGVHRRDAPPIEAISKSTKYTADGPASEQTPSASLVSSIHVSLSLRRAILHLRLGLPSLRFELGYPVSRDPSSLVPPRIAS